MRTSPSLVGNASMARDSGATSTTTANSVSSSSSTVKFPEDVAVGVAQHVAAHVPTPSAADADALPADVVSAKREEAEKEARDSGKPQEIAEKIAEGKMRKFFEEVTLLGQKYVRDDSMQVRDILPKGVTVTSFHRMRVGEGGE